jgi:pimeloyl-ACP methyl ester carboxylesterase
VNGRPSRAGLIVALLLPLTAFAAQVSVKDIPTRPGVTQRVLLIKPEQPVASVVLFAGGNGLVHIGPDGNIGRGGNFLVRTRELFAQQNLAVAVVDAPSDRVEGPGLEYFRQTADHAVDIEHVVAFLRKEVNAPLWLVGTSRGTVSVANAAIRLGGKGIDGIVLTSAIVGNDRERVPAMNIAAIKVPTLVVHHEDDQCRICLFSDVKSLMDGLESTRSELVAFTGGGPARGKPCEARHYHGFIGIEDDVVKRIADWIKASSPGRT